MSLTIRLLGAFVLCAGFLLGQPSQGYAQDLPGDVKAGAKVFKKKCKSCHTAKEGGKHRVGPNLYDIFDMAAAQKEGFKYSKAMIAFGTEQNGVWDAATLDKYLTKPRKFIKKTKMSFAGLKKQKDRDNLIAYLASLK